MEVVARNIAKDYVALSTSGVIPLCPNSFGPADLKTLFSLPSKLLNGFTNQQLQDLCKILLHTSVP